MKSLSDSVRAIRHAGAVLGVALLVTGNSAKATLLAYEGFDYTAGQSVVGQGTNAGWPTAGDPYTISAGNSANASIEAPDTSVGNGLLTSGNQLDINGSAPGGNEGVYRDLGATYSTAGNIYWFSALMQVDSNVGASYAGVSLFTNTAEDFFFGQRNRTPFWGIEQHAGSTANSIVSAANSTSAFLVVQLNGITHTASLYVNPNLSTGGIPATASTSLTFTDFAFNRLRIEAGVETLDVDEIRFGTTYGDVTPTASAAMQAPEPPSALCSALLLLGLPVFRELRVRLSSRPS